MNFVAKALNFFKSIAFFFPSHYTDEKKKNHSSDKGGNKMNRKHPLLLALSAAMVMGTSAPAFAAEA
ncbi:hypothetical protein, partial [Anaerotignum faecicola]